MAATSQYGENKMKTFQIFSPAYKANGYYGTYLSIAICDDNGNFIKLIGDHAINGQCFHDYKNIYKIVGLPFSDADRFIEISEVNINETILSKWESDYNESKINRESWYSLRTQVFGESIYDFIYDKKGKENSENSTKYNLWIAQNPCPKAVAWYDFLKSIVHEN